MKVGVVCDSLVWLGVVWYGLVKILKLNSRTLINESMTKVGIELLGQLKNGKSWSFGPTRGGGLTESQLFVKFFQNQICLGTVHKCDETHTTQMGRQYLINS